MQGVEHHIPTPPWRVVRVPFRPTPLAMKGALEKQVQSMLALGMVEVSISPCHNPSMLVPKPDGSLRFCINFRRLNDLTDFDAYPMPCINNILDRIGGGAQVLSTLSITQGY